MTNQDAVLLAKEAWEEYRKSHEQTIQKVRCQTCRRNGSTPCWPPTHEGKKCPVCGHVLPRASIPF